MSLREFIRIHRQEITELVRKHYNVDVTNDREREQWVMNDEGLYRWARSERVKNMRNMMKKKKWWLGATEKGTLEIKYIISPIRQSWVNAKSFSSVYKALDFVESLGRDPRVVKGLPPFVFGKPFKK